MTRVYVQPIGRITPSGYGVERAAGAAHWYALYEGPQSVFVSDNGAVFATPSGTHTERALLADHADWFIGHYVARQTRRRQLAIERGYIIADLRARAAELREVAA